LIVSGVLLTLATNCGREEAPLPGPRGPVPLTKIESFGNEIYPLSNGDAYLLNQHDEQLFFLTHGIAVRVDGVDLRGLDPTIYPLANGAAYLASSDNSNLRLYYLVRGNAEEVKESSQVPSAQSREAPSREGFLWAQAQAANIRLQRNRRNEEEQQTSEEPERDDYP
jgi:hypothetical protein